mmetsp:Transcript_30142/g.54631  ORF Transcript_30142/g.54631 Transcript_30142/m.54631 type:complete len:215 (-) Transcript_30142:1992-2636(-)
MKLLICEQATLQSSHHLWLIHVEANADKLVLTITKSFIPQDLNILFKALWPFSTGNDSPPRSSRSHGKVGTCQGPCHLCVIVTSEPKNPFESNKASESTSSCTSGLHHLMEPLRMKWPPILENKGSDSKFHGLWLMFSMPGFCKPFWIGLSFRKVESADFKNTGRRNVAKPCLYYFCFLVDFTKQQANLHQVSFWHQVDFVQHDDVGKFDLVEK